MPYSYESKFCAVPGQKGGRHTLLEGTAFELTNAVEAFALQEAGFAKKKKATQPLFRRFYVPIIVTTAQLSVAWFEPASISLIDGSIPTDKATVETVPYIRFRKTLTSNFSNLACDSVQEASKISEKSVIIVNAQHWNEFLNRWELD